MLHTTRWACNSRTVSFWFLLSVNYARCILLLLLSVYVCCAWGGGDFCKWKVHVLPYIASKVSTLWNFTCPKYHRICVDARRQLTNKVGSHGNCAIVRGEAYYTTFAFDILRQPGVAEVARQTTTKTHTVQLKLHTYTNVWS